MKASIIADERKVSPIKKGMHISDLVNKKNEICVRSKQEELFNANRHKEDNDKENYLKAIKSEIKETGIYY
jgi:hypothetical protein